MSRRLSGQNTSIGLISGIGQFVAIFRDHFFGLEDKGVESVTRFNSLFLFLVFLSVCFSVLDQLVDFFVG